MGKWEKQPDTSTHNIPATPGETTYNSDPYYIGLFKNDEPKPTTITISDFTITKSKWIKDVSLGNKSPYGDYYPLTYKVDENTDTSERVGHISITHSAANKTLKYIIKQAANNTQEPTEPTPNTYSFTAYYTDGNKGDGDSYSLQVGSQNVGSESDPFASSINDGDQLDIDITMSNPYTEALQSNLEFEFTIRCDGLDYNATINEADGSGDEKIVHIKRLATSSDIGTLKIALKKIESKNANVLVINIIIFPGNQLSTIEQPQLSKGITGTIRINDTSDTSVSIPFVVTLGFGALQQ